MVKFCWHEDGDRVRTIHAVVDAVELAGVVAADASQAFARWRGATGLLRKHLRVPGLLVQRAEVVHLQVAIAVDASRGRQVLRLDRDEADSLAVVQGREGEARRALQQCQPGAVEGIPNREVRLLRGKHADVVAGPGAAAWRRGTGVGVHLSAGRRIEPESLGAGIDVVIRRAWPFGKRRHRLQRGAVIGDELTRQVSRADVGNQVEGAETGIRGVVETEPRDRKRGVVVLLREDVGLARVVVEVVALRRLVADARRAGQRLHLVRHVRAAHRARRIEQQHDVRLDHRGRRRHQRDVGDVGGSGVRHRTDRRGQRDSGTSRHDPA